MAKQNLKPQSGKRKLVAKANPKSPISEQYRTIRTNIEFSAVDEEIRTLMVTSSGPAEGKSTTTANLAVVFAQQGKKVLIVDADMRKPTVHYTFGVTNTIGLTNVLTRQATLEDAARSTDVENLHVLSSGPIPPNPAELLGSKGMQLFFEKGKELYDMVIFDTPPVLAVTDAQILANKCDGTVLVVASGKTELESAQKTKELLAAAQAKLLGVVLNNKKMEKTDYYYYYGTN
ncbi:capsular exopolysaccharide synthesis family protein [Lederbergia galactosidilyticus]|uniref:CpsD/CapB family tyrosine-protein kinase n=1 Tax=Lederbergia galactosidilytica TaxID=217031 RepID=UPI001DADB9C3|nr:CpsD/CapB family tyrosine-protein kinase [Lederbergia galactosidilytica]MBP1915432.1 capsular exopolysaccharide synthesis family protein [Lederbergia galactosidilytica]